MKRTPLLMTTLVASAALLAGCGSSSGGSTATATDGGTSNAVTTTGAADAQTATVGMNDKLKFDPTTVNAKVGTVTLEVKNEGGVPHNLTFDEASLGKTKTVSGHGSEPLRLVFDKAGTFTFQCTFHSGMTGKVVVS